MATAACSSRSALIERRVGRFVNPLIASMLAVGVASVPRPSAGDDAAIVEEIKNAWATQASEVQSARIRIRHVSLPAKSGQTRESIAAIFDGLRQAEAVGDEDSLRRAVEVAVGSIVGSRAPKEWGIQEIVVEGKSIRNTGIFRDSVHREAVLNQGVRVEYHLKSEAATVSGGGKGDILVFHGRLHHKSRMSRMASN